MERFALWDHEKLACKCFDNAGCIILHHAVPSLVKLASEPSELPLLRAFCLSKAFFAYNVKLLLTALGLLVSKEWSR